MVTFSLTPDKVTLLENKGGLRVGWAKDKVVEGGLPFSEGGLRVGCLFRPAEKGGLDVPIT